MEPNIKRVDVAILGGGPAGLGAAWQLAKQGKTKSVVVYEQRGDVGGNAGSFVLEGIPVDYGSHRLHPSCKENILRDISSLLGDGLLDRPRHGRIRLRGQWIHFPLKPVDLVMSLPWSFGLGAAWDAVRKMLPHSNGTSHETFATVLKKGLGSTICRDFYFPYAVKIWGVEPGELSAIQAHRRVSAGSLGKMIGKVLGSVPGLKPPGAGRFYYPRQGFGHISQSLSQAAQKLGVDIQLKSTVHKLSLGDPHRIEVERDGAKQTIEAKHIWSTIPVSILAKIANPAAPAQVIKAGQSIQYRAIILIYLVLEQPQFTPFDAHYFPEAHVKLTRLSEPKNYSVRTEPKDRTVLCGELPCNVGDEMWLASDEELGEVVKDSLSQCGLPVRSKVHSVVIKRLPHAYPIYHQGYEKHFDVLDQWASGLDRVLSFGRQGLFAHDNTHHALAMAYAAVDCLRASGEFDTDRWAQHRKEFESHVVED